MSKYSFGRTGNTLQRKRWLRREERRKEQIARRVEAQLVGDSAAGREEDARIELRAAGYEEMDFSINSVT